jgi:predicted alpha/beta hydrolase family esterase
MRDIAHDLPVVLTVPGLNGSDERHWQTLWERQRDDCVRANLGHWDDPYREDWIRRLDGAVYGCGENVILVAHSLGCMAVAHWAQAYERTAARQVTAALLVAPCDPERAHALPPIARFAPVPGERLPFPSILVASTNDPFARIDRSRHFAELWGATFVEIGMQGHINSDSDLKAWDYGLELLEELRQAGTAANLDAVRHRQTLRYGIG